MTRITAIRISEPIPRFWHLRYNQPGSEMLTESQLFRSRNTLGIVASEANIVLEYARAQKLMVHQLNHAGEVHLIQPQVIEAPNSEYGYWSVELQLKYAGKSIYNNITGVVAASIYDAVELAVNKASGRPYDADCTITVLSANKRGTINHVLVDQFVQRVAEKTAAYRI